MPSTSRRALLGALAGGSVAALAGCSSSCPDSGTPDPEQRVATDAQAGPFDGPPATDWPAPRHDAANTGFAPDATPPEPPLGVRWRADVGGGVDGPVASPPVVAGGRVVVSTRNGVTALRFTDGAGEWHADGLEPAVRPSLGRYGEEPAAPVVDGDTVYVATREALVALDANDGTERWRFEDASTVGPPAVRDGEVYAVADGEVLAVDAADGGRRWRVPGDLEPRPLAVTGDAVVASGATVTAAVERADGSERWRAPVGFEGAPVVADGTVLVGGYEGLRALDLATGEQRWTFDRGDGRTISMPVVADDTLYVVEQPGEAGDATFALDRTADGPPEPRWCSDVGEGAVTAATPGRAFGLLPDGVAPDEQGPPLHLVAFDERLGDTAWGLALDEALLAPAVVDRAVVVTDRSGTVRALGVV